MRKIAFALLAITLTSPAVAGDQVTSQGNAAPPKKPHQICKRDQASTGSRLAPLVCKTAAQWQAIDEQGSDKLNDLTRARVQGAGTPTMKRD